MVMEVKGLTRPQAWTTHVMEADANRNVVLREGETYPLFTTDCDLFCQGELCEDRMGAYGVREERVVFV